MFLFQLRPEVWSPETTIGFLGVLGLVVAGLWVFVQGLLAGPVAPDPWDSETAAAIEESDARPLCHRCLSPNDSGADFCVECGAAIGQYTNWLPYPYIFSLGHTMRIGTAGEFKRSPMTVLGFLLLPLAEYFVFAPLYWFVFLRHLPRGRQPEGAAELQPPA